jgi:hypothetical protein
VTLVACPDEKQEDLDLSPMLGLFASTVGLGVFDLTTQPASVPDIVVTVNGNQVLGFSYDAIANSIVFNPGEVPAVGAVVTVTYPVGCP